MTIFDAAIALLVVAIVVPLTIVAMRHRDRLLKNFDHKDFKIRSSCQMADGVRLTLVDIGTVTVLYAQSRAGHVSLQVMPNDTTSSVLKEVRS